MKLKNILFLIPALLLGLSSCNYLDIVPVGEVIPETVTDFRGVLTSGYYYIPKHKQLLNVRSDEMDMPGSSSSYMDIARWNDATTSTSAMAFPWLDFYRTIFYANTVIHEGANATPDGSEPIEQLHGEAYLLRAYMHFELVNMYGKPYNEATAATDKAIPLNLVTDIEQVFRRATVAKVYEQVEKDIEQGLNLISLNQQEGSKKYRFSRSSAFVFKARVKLYKKDYASALESAKAAMALGTLSNLNTKALSPINYMAEDNLMASDLVSNSNLNNSRNFTVTDKIMALYDSANDLRPTYYFNGQALIKGAKSEERVGFRMAEAYLIAAEAAAHMGNTTDAVAYLSSLAENRLKPEGAEARKTVLATMSKDELIAEIANERIRELIGEGHRWYDLRRTTQEELSKTVNKVAVTLPQGDPRYTLRIPQSAIEANPELQD